MIFTMNEYLSPNGNWFVNLRPIDGDGNELYNLINKAFPHGDYFIKSWEMYDDSVSFLTGRNQLRKELENGYDQ